MKEKHEGWIERSCDNCLTRKRILRAVKKPSSMAYAWYTMRTHCIMCSIGDVALKTQDIWEEDK